MGERELAPVRAVKAVAAACQEAIGTRVEPVDEGMRVNTPGGMFTVRWDARGSATALCHDDACVELASSVIACCS